MQGERPRSISIEEFSGTVKTAVAASLKRYPQFGGDHEISILPYPGVIGFIIRDFDLGEASLAEVSGLASDIAAGIGGVSAGARKTIIINNGGVTVGFMPIDDVLTLARL